MVAEYPLHEFIIIILQFSMDGQLPFDVFAILKISVIDIMDNT